MSRKLSLALALIFGVTFVYPFWQVITIPGKISTLELGISRLNAEEQRVTKEIYWNDGGSPYGNPESAKRLGSI